MVKGNHPEIIFVDGPTAVGKDYFIDKLYEHLTNELELSVDVVRAADFTVVSEQTSSENRKYEFYSTDDEKVQFIFKGHNELLDYLDRAMINDNEDVDVIIVNRSFISFLVYNLHQYDRRYLKEELLHQYRVSFLDKLSRYDTLFIGLFLDRNGETNHEELINRIKSRNEDKPVDTYWLEILVESYKRNWCCLNDIMDNYEIATSDDHYNIVSKYFLSASE